MIYLSDLTEIGPDKYVVGYVHHQPFSEEYGLRKTKSELEQTGYFVESIPQPSQIEGKEPIICYSKNSNTIFYEYQDKPPTEEELRIAELENQAIYNLDLDFRLSKIELGL
jgi:hypothetical protein